MRCIVNPSICIASCIAIFYSISSDNQRLLDILPYQGIGLQRWEWIGKASYLLASVVAEMEKKRRRELTTRKTRLEKKIIDGGRRGRRGGHRRIEKGGPCRTVLPKPRSIVMKMAVHMTTIAAE